MFVRIGDAEVEIMASLYTLVVYEQEFGSDLIKDVFGKHQVQNGDETVLTIDYTQENWFEELKALWAMVKTAADLKDSKGELAPNDRVPGFNTWAKSNIASQVNMREIADVVFTEAVSGFFRAGAADSE